MSEGDDIVAAFLGREGFECMRCHRTAHALGMWLVFSGYDNDMACIGECCSETCSNETIAAQPEPELCWFVPPAAR